MTDKQNALPGERIRPQNPHNPDGGTPSTREALTSNLRGLEHELKVASDFFDAVEAGRKPFEIRKGDRPFKVGDILWLREVDLLLAYTGRESRKRITFCLRGWGLEPGYVALGLAPLTDETRKDDARDAARYRVVRVSNLFGVSVLAHELDAACDALIAKRSAQETSVPLTPAEMGTVARLASVAAQVQQSENGKGEGT